MGRESLSGAPCEPKTADADLDRVHILRLDHFAAEPTGESGHIRISRKAGLTPNDRPDRKTLSIVDCTGSENCIHACPVMVQQPPIELLIAGAEQFGSGRGQIHASVVIDMKNHPALKIHDVAVGQRGEARRDGHFIGNRSPDEGSNLIRAIAHLKRAEKPVMAYGYILDVGLIPRFHAFDLADRAGKPR